MRLVTLDDKRPEVLRAIEYAKSKGATAIKVELEALLRRFSDRYSDVEYCEYCDEGSNRCGDCDGDEVVRCDMDCNEGYIDSDIEGEEPQRCPELCNDGYIDCPNDCDEGWVTCDECHGDYRIENENESWNNERALTYILEKLGINEGISSDYDDAAYHYNPGISDWLQYAKFYNDGSVDSELTFTVRLDNPESVFKILEVVNAWNDLAEAIGNGMDTDGAGMHMAWIFSTSCGYPEDQTVDSISLDNFRRAINQMMPALYFLAAPANGSNWTRGFRFRMPDVSIRNEKYSAIYFYGNAMEFRVFDTCYDTPTQVLDNIVVMSNCLKYLSRTYNGPKLSPEGTDYRFGHDNDRTLDRLFYEENTLDLLYEHIGKLKPKYYSMTELRQQRAMTATKTKIKKRKLEIRRNAELAWKEYEDRWKILFSIKSEQVKLNAMERFASDVAIDELRGLTNEQIQERVKENTERRLRELENQRTPMDRFISSTERSQSEKITARYHVYVN